MILSAGYGTRLWPLTEDRTKPALPILGKPLVGYVAEYLAKNHESLEKKVYPVPEELDKKVARLKLEAMGVKIDKLTAEQEEYLASWSEGT